MTRMHATLAVLAMLAATLAPPLAQAAEVTAAEDEDGVTCDMDFKSKPPLSFTAIQGSGSTGRIQLNLSRPGLDKFSQEDDLRLKVALYEDDPARPLLGYVDEMTGDATFVVPLSLLAEMTGVETFSYRFEKDKPVQLKSISKDELKQFLACMEKR